jgi:AraC-like DNA-binding protein
MDNLLELRSLFHPVQPRFREGGQEVSYKEVTPDAALAPYICCYWQLKSNEILCRDFTYTAVADGCIDFFFDLDNPGEQFVMGFSSEYTSFALKKDFNYAGIRFFPGAFPALYHVKASELTNQCYSISEVMPRTFGQLKALLAGQSALAPVKLLLDDYFKKNMLAEGINVDSRFVASFYDILKAGGALLVEQQLQKNVSSRHLRRLFDYYIGAAPKELNKIVRFQKFLRNNTSREMLKQEKLYYDLGYYDQSHFIKDFKLLYGLSPLKAFL